MTGSWRPGCDLSMLETRSRLLQDIREFFRERQVLEVQTGTIGAHTVTDVNIESLPVGDIGYLQTSPEYQMKRLLAAGAPSIYQLGPVFRAGEQGRLHNPEFTLLEWYRLGFDDDDLMKEVADLVDQVLGPASYQTITYRELLGEAGVDGNERMAEGADPLDRADAPDLAFSDAVRDLGVGRWFITRYPAEQAALARLCADDRSVAARFELVVDGVELANGYHELTDAAEQRQRFSGDREQRRAGSLPDLAPDERFLVALEEGGLPDCAGVALGMDRLLMLATGAASLAEVMPFSWSAAEAPP